MEPKFHEGEGVFVSSLYYKIKNPRKGDVIILLHPFRKIFIIKRIEEILSDGRYKVASDNPYGEDSTSFGPIKRKEIIGKVLCKY